MSETQAIDWESRYRDGAAGWERHGLNPAFLAWRELGVLAPCRILIPGGGRSLEPLALAEAGFDVTVVDAAPSAVASQRAHFERLKVRARTEQADLFAWDPDAAFDVVYDQTCLCALPPACGPTMPGACTVGCVRRGGCSSCSCRTIGRADRRSIAISMPCAGCSRRPPGPGR